MSDDQQDTGYLILSLTETMQESRRLRKELQAGAKAEAPEAEAGKDGRSEAERPGSILP